MQLVGAVALVTGASAGIGRAVAHQLSARGVRVLVHGRDPDRVHDVAADCGGTALLADLSIGPDRARLAEQAQQVFGRVDILVNNAGVGWSGPFASMPLPQLERLIELDLRAALELSHALLPGMLTRGHGRLCFIASVAGRTGVAGEAVYAAAKAGIDIFAESLRAEVDGTGVEVGVVVPGAVRTGFFTSRGRPYDRRRPRLVPPEAVAAAVVRGIVSGRDETWIPRWLAVAPAVRALAPRTYRRLARRFGDQQRSGPHRSGPDRT